MFDYKIQMMYLSLMVWPYYGLIHFAKSLSNGINNFNNLSSKKKEEVLMSIEFHYLINFQLIKQENSLSSVNKQDSKKIREKSS